MAFSAFAALPAGLLPRDEPQRDQGLEFQLQEPRHSAAAPQLLLRAARRCGDGRALRCRCTVMHRAHACAACTQRLTPPTAPAPQAHGRQQQP